MLADILTDLRHGLRQFAKTPGFSIVAVLTLAVGIGASSAIFSVVNGVMLRPLPYPASESLVRVLEVVPQYGHFSVAPANFLDWRQQNTVFQRMAAYQGGTSTFAAAEGPERLTMTLVSWDVFDLLQVSPALGRSFKADEDLSDRNNVIVISHGMWQRRLGADPQVLGRSIVLSGTPVTVVGVMPPGFHFPARDTEFWRPLGLNPSKVSRGAHYLSVLGRLKPGITVERARTEMKGIAERLASQYPDASANESADAIVWRDLIIGPIRPMLWTLLAAVAVVVLIACANIANLLLVRASVREKEIAIRAALGASQRRLARQMLVESLVLAFVGGAVGLLIAYLSIGPIQTLGERSIPRVADVTLDRTVLLFALAISMGTGLLFGLAPAWHATRGGLGAILKEGGRSSATSGGHWTRSALLVVEVALSIVLLVGAALLLRSFARLVTVDPGFAPNRVLAFRVGLPRNSYPEDHNRTAFFDRLLERLQSTPGIESVGMSHVLPMRGSYVLSFDIKGRPPARPGEEASAYYRAISPGYFKTLGVPLRRGRLFGARDTDKSPLVAVVDEAFARRHFSGGDAIGQGIDIGNGTDGFFEIVGVVGDVHSDGLDEAAAPTMYVPFKQDVFDTMWIVAKTQGDPAEGAPLARQALRDLDPALPAFSMTPLATVVSESVSQRRFSMLLLALFALVALFLSAVGLYGVVAYTVTQRTQEIGVRMAIGATTGDVLRMVLGGGMKLAMLGVVLGLAGALALGNLIATLLYGVTASDPASYAGTAVLLLAVAALACYVPARRATRVDPLVALRQE